jgi:hypothetical protein
MQVILDRIAAWEAAGLIDGETASRLRSDETDRAGDAANQAPDDAAPQGRRPRQSTATQVFGPGVSIGEMFAYLGGAFILGAFNAFLVRIAGFDADGGIAMAIGFGIVAAVLIAIGRYLVRGDARQRRAAGVLFAVAVGHVATAGVALTAALDIDFAVAGVIVGALSVVVATALRLYHPALLTQFALLASLTGLAAAVLSAIEQVVVPDPLFTDTGALDPAGRPEPLLLLVASAAWWLGFAVLLGILGLTEDRDADDPTAGRRAALTRLWAGVTAVAGLASAVFQTGYSSTGEWGRVLEPWVADLALIVLAIVLVERAFRRGANTFVYAAALALFIALTDFNFTYLSDGTEAGLLVEGLILLGAGFAVGRLRERIGRDDTDSGTTVPAPV